MHILEFLVLKTGNTCVLFLFEHIVKCSPCIYATGVHMKPERHLLFLSLEKSKRYKHHQYQSKRE